MYTVEQIQKGIEYQDPTILYLLKSDLAARLRFTPEKFEVLNPVKLNVGTLEYSAIIHRNYNLHLYLSKHYELECNLNGSLDRGVVTIYNPNADYDTMIENGYIPYQKSISIFVVELYKQDYINEEIKFLTGVDNAYHFMSSCPMRAMVTKGYLEQEANKGNSYPMLFFNTDMLYKSMRPKTSMAMYQTCNSNYYDELPEDNFIPVTRYGEGMSKGLYHKTDRPENVCGYFYYYEEESSTYLSYNTSVTYFNKTQAAYDMMEKVEGNLKIKLEKEIDKVDKDIF